MLTFIEPSDINLEVVNRALTTEEENKISQHIAAYKARKQRAALIAALTEQLEEIDFLYIQSNENQYLKKKNDIFQQLKALYQPLHLDLVFAA